MLNKTGTANTGKIMAWVLGVILFGSMAPTAFGYLSNISTALSDAGYGWATIIVGLGIIMGAIYLFLPKRK